MFTHGNYNSVISENGNGINKMETPAGENCLRAGIS